MSTTYLVAAFGVILVAIIVAWLVGAFNRAGQTVDAILRELDDDIERRNRSDEAASAPGGTDSAVTAFPQRAHIQS